MNNKESIFEPFEYRICTLTFNLCDNLQTGKECLHYEWIGCGPVGPLHIGVGGLDLFMRFMPGINLSKILLFNDKFMDML